MINNFKTVIKKFAPEFIVSLAYFLMYYPYFTLVKVAKIDWDSYVYFSMAKDLFEGGLPFKDYIYDFPYGFSFFIYFIYSLGGNLDCIILIQTVISLLSVIFLINQVKRTNYKISFFFSIILSLYCILSESLTWNVMLYTESLFLSVVMLISGSIVSIYRGVSLSKLIFLSLILLLALYLRSNAIVFFIIPFLIIILYWKKNKKIVFAQLFLVLIILCFNSSTNFICKGYFAPGELKRFFYVFQQLNNKLPNQENQSFILKSNNQIKNERTYINQFFDIYSNLANSKMGNFYYYRIPNSLPKLHKDSMLSYLNKNPVLEGYFNSPVNKEELVEFVFKNYNINEHHFSKVEKLLDIEIKPRDPLIYLMHIIHFGRFIIKNSVVCMIFYLLFFVSLFRIINIKERKLIFNNNWILVFSFGALYLILLFPVLLAGKPNDPSFIGSIPRYSIVFEPLALLSMSIGVFAFFNDYLKSEID